MPGSALVVGATGIVGGNLAEHLITRGWEVYGLARNPARCAAGVRPVIADLGKPGELKQALANIPLTHVFLCTWSRRATEAENSAVNGAMVRNCLMALPAPPVHVALVTGLKHYLGPFEAYAKSAPITPFREEQPRLPYENFYYVQEDEVFAAARQQGFSWSVHRPHTVIGYAIGNAMNMGVTLAVYATICRESGRPFVFPGSLAQWNALTDVTDARLLARHLEWAATADAARNEAFNVVNGDIFRWNWLWPRLAAFFGLAPAAYPATPNPLERQMRDSGPIWAEIAARHRLAEADVGRLASWWHTDADLGREIECVTDMSKSRRKGFSDYHYSPDAFFDLFRRLQENRIIPHYRSTS